MYGGFNRLLGTGALPPLLLCIPSGCGHPLGQVCLFVTLDRKRRITLVIVPFRCCHPFLGSSWVKLSYSYVILRIVGTSCGWWLLSCLACRCSLTVGCLLLASSAAAVDLLSCGCAPTVCLATGSLPSFLSFALQLPLDVQVTVGSLLPYGSQPS